MASGDSYTRCAYCGTTIRYYAKPGQAHAEWVNEWVSVGKPFVSSVCNAAPSGKHVALAGPAGTYSGMADLSAIFGVPSKPAPKLAPVKSNYKCKYCTRLIHVVDGPNNTVTWERVNSSKSQPGRPDSKCIKSFDGKHHPPAGVVTVPAKPKTAPLDQDEKVKSLSELLDEASQGTITVGKAIADSIGPLNKVLQELTAGITEPVITDPLIGPRPLHHTDPSKISVTCDWCMGRIVQSDHEWLDDPQHDKWPEVCTGPEMSTLSHKPHEFCAICKSPFPGCKHWQTRDGMHMFYRRSLWEPERRWLGPSCCQDCWQAEQLGDLDNHCRKCMCCGCRDCPLCGFTPQYLREALFKGENPWAFTANLDHAYLVKNGVIRHDCS